MGAMDYMAYEGKTEQKYTESIITRKSARAGRARAGKVDIHSKIWILIHYGTG